MLKAIEQAVRENMARVASLGNWPVWMNAEQALFGRLPLNSGENAPGFDAGLACCLGIIPRDKQKLSATLHAAYTEEAVEQIRREVLLNDDDFADTETCWWLAACRFCHEGGVDSAMFVRQTDAFAVVADDHVMRVQTAREEFAAMSKSFTLHADGTPFITKDGGMQGAYVAGHDWAVEWTSAYGIFFIGTFRASLGLPEDFDWSDYQDADGRPMSGPVHGSKQFVKCSTLDELAAVVTIVREHLSV